MPIDMQAFEELAERVKRLEEHNHRLRALVDPERSPFVFDMLAANASEQQENAIYDLMDETRALIRAEKPLHHSEFEQRVYGIFPAHERDYHFAEGIVRALNDTGQYPDIFAYYQQHGMNLSL